MAYAALLSLSHTAEQALHCDHQFLIPDEKQNMGSLLEIVSLLLDFLFNSPQIIIEREEGLESEIIDVAYKAEDIIESYIQSRFCYDTSETNTSKGVHFRVWKSLKAQFLYLASKPKSYMTGAARVIKELVSKPASQQDDSFKTLSQNIEKVVEEILAMTNQVMKLKLKIDEKRGVRDQQQSLTSVPVQSSTGAPGNTSTTAWADDGFRKIKHLLIGGTSNLQIVSIYGMGGIGKTTLAQKVFNDASVKLHFDYCAWVTVSQEFTVEKILLGLLGDIHETTRILTERQIDKLKDNVHKNLKNRRYLVVMDDVWDNKVWDHVKRLLPNDNNGSRIMLTTRMKAVASYPEPNPRLHSIDLLNDNDSWKLFFEKVFGKDPCPSELEGIGINIVQQCGGLPLAIIVIGGLFSKLPRTRYEWENVAGNLEDLLSNSDDQDYSRIWSLSYYHLPHHLKGCYLYMGVFPEDFDIRSSILTKLWVAEGLIKPVRSRNLEEVAVDYLRDLTERSLVSVSQSSSLGEVKTCKIHDVLRDFCLSEATRVRFLHVHNRRLSDIPDGTRVRRFSIHELRRMLPRSNPPTSFTRSILEFCTWFSHYRKEFSYPDFLRILHVHHPLTIAQERFLGPRRIRELANLRYIFDNIRSLESIYECQNLQSLILQAPRPPIQSFPIHGCTLKPEFWKMEQLRHVQSVAALDLPDPPRAQTQGQSSKIVLENLQTLSIVNNFRCTAEVLDQIPNLQKLGIYYGDEIIDWGYYSLNSLDKLHKLEALKCLFNGLSTSFLRNVTFPNSLKKLSLVGGELCWEDMEILGMLCNLRVLKLKDYAFTGREWEVKECNFARLEFLLLDSVYLVHWIAENTCFQTLQRLVIKNCPDLRKIPSVIGENSNLQSIELHCCSNSLIRSAKEIEEEQRENFGNEIIQLLISQDKFGSFMYCVSLSSFLLNLLFLPSLVKITLRNCALPWKYMTIFLGSLPKLEVLELRRNAFSGPLWESCGGEFMTLRFLSFEEINLQVWIAGSDCFPDLESIVIKKCKDLLRIPDHFKYNSTLQAIQIHDCAASLGESAMKIQEKQFELGNELFDVVIT